MPCASSPLELDSLEAAQKPCGRPEAFKKPILLLTELLGPHWLLGALLHAVVCTQIRCPLRSSVLDGASINAPFYVIMYKQVRKMYVKVASSRDLCEMEPVDPKA